MNFSFQFLKILHLSLNFHFIKSVVFHINFKMVAKFICYFLLLLILVDQQLDAPGGWVSVDGIKKQYDTKAKCTCRNSGKNDNDDHEFEVGVELSTFQSCNCHNVIISSTDYPTEDAAECQCKREVKSWCIGYVKDDELLVCR